MRKIGKASDRPQSNAPGRRRRGNERANRTKRRPEPKPKRANVARPVAASTAKIDAATSGGDNASDDAASTRFEAEFVFPSVFLRGGARRASKRKVRDVASLAVLLDASKRFFANLCEIVRKFDRR